MLTIAGRLIFERRKVADGDVYALASQRAIASPEVIRVRGSPIKASLKDPKIHGTDSDTSILVLGSRWFNLHRRDASAVVRIHLAGTKNPATLFCYGDTVGLRMDAAAPEHSGIQSSQPDQLPGKKGRTGNATCSRAPNRQPGLA